MKAGWYDLINGRTVRREDGDDDDARYPSRRTQPPAGYIGCVVTIVDVAGKPVSGAIVSLSVSGLANGNIQLRTDRSGQAEVVTSMLPASMTGSITFAVTAVQCPGKTYDATRNAVTSVTFTR